MLALTPESSSSTGPSPQSSSHGYFRLQKYARYCTGSLQKSDGMIFYCPHNKQLCTSSDYKLNEGWHTTNTFNLQYDDGIFEGLYNHGSPNSSVEPFLKVHQFCFLFNLPMIKTKLFKCEVLSFPCQFLIIMLSLLHPIPMHHVM